MWWRDRLRDRLLLHSRGRLLLLAVAATPFKLFVGKSLLSHSHCVFLLLLVLIWSDRAPCWLGTVCLGVGSAALGL
jgi:hypothetical protein